MNPEISRPNGNLSVMMELRPALDEFAGIPQETRLLFSLFADLNDVELTGLLNHSVRHLPRGLRPDETLDGADPHKHIVRLARIVVALTQPGAGGKLRRTAHGLNSILRRRKFDLSMWLGRDLEVTRFEPEPFKDFVWESLFSKTLPPDELPKVTQAKFAVAHPSWGDLQRIGMRSLNNPRFPKIDTSEYDVFISQTPWPSRIAARTRLVVRYHDAIPIFLPHTISSARLHQRSHYTALVSNQKNGVFVCTSSDVRGQLLKVFPALEKRSTVIHDIVSHNYYSEPVDRPRILEIVRNRIHAGSARITNEGGGSSDATGQLLSKTVLGATSVEPEAFRYLLVVSTIEPRKNHVRTIAAWERVLARTAPDVRMILVGMVGWSADRALDAMRPWQSRGQLFHLSRVPTDDLRALYAGALGVLCPSVAEGFDLSGIEAMLCGCPVLASDIPVHREVYGEACLFFDPYSTSNMAEVMDRIVRPDADPLRADLSARGLAHGPRYRREGAKPKWEAFFEELRGGRYGPPPGVAVQS